MSINVTVNGNPVNIRKGRMVLSDLDQIKKNERDRRRRLRLEQVRQQSKEISNRLLERAKSVAQRELSRLEKDGRSELKQMHDRKIMEIQQKYQEDMEDIGQAHLAAALQPDFDAIMEAEMRRNRASAVERGREAAQKLKDSEKEDPRTLQQERLRKVREMENARATAVSQSKQSSSNKEEKSASASQIDNTAVEVVNEKTSKKVKVTKPITKKSPPVKVIMKSNVRVVAHNSKVASPSTNRKTTDQELKNQASPSGTQKKIKEKEKRSPNLDPAKTPYVSESTTLPRLRTNPDSEIEEIEEHCSDIDKNVSSTKSSKPPRYNPKDYIHESPASSSSSDSSSSSSISEDSSYFSDAVDPPLVKGTPKLHSQSAGSKVQLYDHNTRQRNAYDKPSGIVERIDIRNEPNAEDLAREVLESESVNADLLKKRKTSAERRGQDALLRERVRRDYQNLLQNLDHLSREERKLKASQIHEPPNLHMSPTRRKDFQKKRQRKMNRALEEILRSSENLPYSLTEKIVTLKPQEDPDDIQIIPEASWQDPPFRESMPPRSPERKESLDELSREEQILELLQKVERQKRILLREFGASLPSDVFSSSKKPDDSKPSESSKPRSPVQRPPTPEIQVINVSTHEEVSKLKIQEEKKVTQLSEIAVQTSTIENDSAEDKGVQVELAEDRCQITETNKGISEDINKIPEDQTKENKRHYPLEPDVKILTPENVDSSSASSIITDLVINFDKKQVQITPKRKKKGTLKISRKISPMVSTKSRSVPGSQASSPIKKSSKSAPPSRLPTPKKSQRTKILEARHNLQVNRGFRAEIDHFGNVTIDSSTESSQIYSTPDNGSAGKVYRIHTRSSKKTIRVRDTSDTTSTSYASPPAAQAAAFLNQGILKDTTPILEMLDSQAVDALHVKKSQISPVSTPETPSPRTMRLPSNVPNPEKISRMLKFNQIEEEARKGKKSHTTSSDQGRKDRQRIRSTPPRSPQKSPQKCSCKNQNCKMHEDFEDIDNQALKNCPEIQKLYEELENVCAERIASLSDLIKKLRNEQKVLPPGVDFSLVSPQDNTSFLQLSSGSLPRDLRDVKNLVENVEAINNQLARTLQESRRIIAGEGIDLPKPPVAYSEIQKSPELSDSRSKESITSSVEKAPQIIQEPAEKLKPSVISNEPVNLNIDKFRILRSPSELEGKNEVEAGKVSQSGHEDMVEKISKEILEQSKSIDKSSGFMTLESLKETDSYLAMKNEFVFDELDSSKEKEQENVSARRNSRSPEKKEDFIPLLAGIPKTPRALPSSNSRGRPPVTLISGPYRPDIASPVHELSTIVEFDTPDTANRSQASVRTSPSKAKRSLATDMMPSSVSPSKKSALKKPLDLSLHKNSNTSKPSVHVAPLPSHRIPQTTPKRSTAQTSASQLFSSSSQIARRNSPKKLDTFAMPEVSKSNFSDSPEQQADKNGELQLEMIHRDEKSTSNILQSDDPQKKMTSTSSNSFSALSGISEIASTPSSDFLKCASSPEEMERTLKKFGLGWAITTLKKTREASALSSSSTSDVTPINTARRIISPIKRQAESHYLYGLPDLSDVSSISIKEASKSTERAVLLKGRTSTPNILNSNSDKSGSTTTSSSCNSFRDPNDSLIVPNLFLSHGKKNRSKHTKSS